MKLYYYRPEGYGAASLFVAAESPADAARAVNAYRAKIFAGPTGPDRYRYGDGYFEPGDFIAAEPGEVIENDND